jgi:hypothetical protein
MFQYNKRLQYQHGVSSTTRNKDQLHLHCLANTQLITEMSIVPTEKPRTELESYNRHRS